jgi:hypothetical protein
MSRLDTSKALVNHLLSNLPTGVLIDDVVFPNSIEPFDPSGKSIWIEYFYNEATSEATGKTDASSNEQRGFFQIDVNIPSRSRNYTNELLQAIDELSASFKYDSNLVYNGQTVTILDSSSPSSGVNGAWYRKHITFNYLTFSSRG